MLNYLFVGRNYLMIQVKKNCVQSKIVWVKNRAALGIVCGNFIDAPWWPHFSFWIGKIKCQQLHVNHQQIKQKQKRKWLIALTLFFFLSPILCNRVMVLHKWHLCAYAGSLISMKKKKKKWKTQAKILFHEMRKKKLNWYSRKINK